MRTVNVLVFTFAYALEKQHLRGLQATLLIGIFEPLPLAGLLFNGTKWGRPRAVTTDQ